MKIIATIVMVVDPDGYNQDYGTSDSYQEIYDDLSNRVRDATEWDLRHYDWVSNIELGK